MSAAAVKVNGLLAPGSPVLAKPFSLHELARRIRGVLEDGGE